MLSRPLTPRGLAPPFVQACAVTDGAHNGLKGVSEDRRPTSAQEGTVAAPKALDGHLSSPEMSPPRISLELKSWNGVVHPQQGCSGGQRSASYFIAAFPTHPTGLDFLDSGLDGPQLLPLLE